MEVVSTDRQHDLVTKRAEYARAGIPEYWIVDPQERRITVLSLDGDAYREHGSWGPGQTADSSSLPGFAVARIAGRGAVRLQSAGPKPSISQTRRGCDARAGPWCGVFAPVRPGGVDSDGCG